MTAAIDFSDLTGVKPQQPKPQGFQTPPPQQNMHKGFIHPIRFLKRRRHNHHQWDTPLKRPRVVMS